MGRDIKRLRADMAASQRILDKSPLLSWDKCAAKWDSALENTKADCQRLKQLVSRLSTETAVNLSEACETITRLAEQVLERMDQLLGLHDDGVLDETAKDMARFLAGVGGYKPNTSEHVMAKFRFYAAGGGFEVTMAQVSLLHGVPRPAILEDSDDELQEQLWLNTFREANCALEVAGNQTGKMPFTTCDAAMVGSVFLDKVQALSESIPAFARDGPGPQTRRYVAMIHTAVLAKDFLSVLPKHFCASCLEDRRDGAACINCNTAICEECFCRKMLEQSAKGWPEARAIARLECDNCRTGVYDEALIRHMCSSSSRLYLQAVRADQSTTASLTAAKERTRENANLLTETTANDILYCAVKNAMADKVTVRTPCCARPFADYDACCAIECDDCHTWFCACCLGGSWDRDGAHRHVETCQSRPATMTGHFLPLQDWKHHMSLRQHNIVQEWVATRPDLPEDVKRRLREDFPLPENSAV